MSLTVIILARDEALHIERCLASIVGLASRAVVIDSGSTDATRALAAAAGADVIEHPWVNYASQFNWALANAGIDTDWTMRLDADEVVLPELRAKLAELARLPAVVAGVTVNRQIHFLGRWIRWGGIYPLRQLRIWRTGHGHCEDRWMDEHVLVDGPIVHIAADIADINLNTVGKWTDKHNGYATREAADVLLAPGPGAVMGMDHRTRARRWLKDNLYARAPLCCRAMAFFLYRYFILLGFLDGWQGLIFHTLQGFWYRFLVDAKLYEIRQQMAAKGLSAAQVLALDYGLNAEAG